MSTTTHINMINLQVLAEDQAARDRQNGTYDRNIAENERYYFWQSEFQTIPMGMENQPEAYAQQLRANLPDVNTLRLPFNAFSFNPDGSLHPIYERFILEAAKQGFQLVLGYFDGEIQGLGSDPGSMTPDQMRAQLNGPIHDRMMESWNKMLDWLDAHPSAASAVYALEAANEPAAYSRTEGRTGDTGEFVRLYGDHMAEFAELVQERSDARVMVGGWAYSRHFNILAETTSSDGQTSVLDQIRQAADGSVVWSAHLYPDWAVRAGQEIEGFEKLIREDYGVLGEDDVILTETNADGGASNDAGGNDPSFWMSRAFEAFHDAGIGIGWFPGAETSNSAFLSIDNGTQIRFRHPDSFAHGMNAFLMGEADPAHAGNEAIVARLLPGFVYDENRGLTGLAGLGYAAGHGGNDTLTGIDRAMNMLFGGNGNDVLHGRAERDYLHGQHGDDVLYGHAGDDVLSGGDGNDVLNGGAGNDLLTGGRGADRFVIAEGGEDVITDYRIEHGDSLMLDGRVWTDDELKSAGQMIDSDGDGKVDDLSLAWSRGRVTLINYGIIRADGIVNGTDGDDQIAVGHRDFQDDQFTWTGGHIHAGDGNDTVIGSMSDDTIFGGLGHDSLMGRDGSDFISGDEGNDTLTGDRRNDTLDGGAGDDSISGGADNDLLIGGTGNDYIDGGEGHDRLMGDAGRDTLVGAGGNDTLMGGDDADFLSDSRGLNFLSGDGGNDTLVGGSDADALYGGQGNDWLDGRGGDDFLSGDDGDDSLAGGGGNDTLVGGAGNDTLNGAIGDDTLKGGDGDDVILDGSGRNFILGEGGNDTVTGSADADTIDGGAGHDRLFGGDGDDVITGGLGNDSLHGGEGHNSLHGGDGDDTLRGGAGNDTLNSGAGNDVISAGRGNNSVNAGAGNDVIDVDMGGSFTHALAGGQGVDQFIFLNAQATGASRAILTDFDPTIDILTIGGLTGFAAISASRAFGGLQENGNDTILQFGDDQYVFKNLDPEDLF